MPRFSPFLYLRRQQELGEGASGGDDGGERGGDGGEREDDGGQAGG